MINFSMVSSVFLLTILSIGFTQAENGVIAVDNVVVEKDNDNKNTTLANEVVSEDEDQPATPNKESVVPSEDATPGKIPEQQPLK